ncbi:MAG: DUF4382 domain-containing protein [Gammaproteobacteria bacterium]|nr:DUF4382 domain-containing protein [Gammaproteobacteria bacterium]
MHNLVRIEVIALLLATGCGQGNFSLSITDAPVDGASNVYVQFTGIELKSAKNEDVVVDFEQAKRIDLLALQGENSEPLLQGQVLSPGDYQSITLKVDSSPNTSTIVVNGAEYSLEIPSGSESGLKMVRGFTVPVIGSADFTVDFDLRKSVVLSNQGYKLKPALRLIDNVEVGHIKGNVDGTTLSSNGCGDSGNAIYVFQGENATPSDMDSSGSITAVLTSASLALDVINNTYHYEVGFLPSGSYTLALTCEANLDNPEQGDSLNFIAQNNVLAEAKKTTIQDF